ncbi:polysaccharide biosynthesis C-terminal domain-containing protein [Geodermatophilus sp. CPCC 205506]|uniref:polysaccharide biosynthesis C-terminal domain-containing protein n=1 Tax=Geodermatophilus sp. CPCC 205506 TaxID=2936596 RepID=UPI003F52978F
MAVTGAGGFLGWHLQCALLADGRHDVLPLGRAETADPGRLAALLRDCDAVVHLAGVNRGSDEAVDRGNRELATTLAEALAGSDVRTVVHANSIHAGTPSAFGQSKAFAAEELARGASKIGAEFTDVVLPNVFGAGGRPHYNSVVATFCHELVAGRRPTVLQDRELPLLHAQDAVDVVIAALGAGAGSVIRPEGHAVTVSELLAHLEDLSGYACTGALPDLSTPFRVALFATFQAFCFPGSFPVDLVAHEDARGTLFEAVQARRTDTLSFVSTTVPGAVRGQHFHRRKIERFVVVDGEAEIRLRRLVTGEEERFEVSGRRPQAVDMPPLWAHSLKNTGPGLLTTVFWANELLDPQQPDTYPSPVHASS